MPAVKTAALKGKDRAALVSQLESLKKELSGLRVQQHHGSNKNTNVGKISDVRKSIARVNTVISKTQRDHLRLYYKGKKHIPIDIRPKRTRAIRRRLSKKEAGAKTLRQTKKEQHFPLRKYAVSA